MSQKRLKELIEQKQLLEGHLAWLENEIAKAKGAPPSNRLEELQSAEDSDDFDPIQTPALEPNPIEEVYETLGPDAKGAANETRRGCMILFGAAIGFLIIGTIAVTFFY